MKKHLLLLAGLVPAIAAANDCRFTAQHDFDIDTGAVNAAAFVLGSSDISVEGVPGLTKIEVRGKACASTEAWLADLGVDQQRRGARVTITPRHRSNNSNWFGSNYAYIDLVVRVPPALAIDIKDGSGDALVRNVATLIYESGSGDLNVREVASAMSAEVSSGDIQGSQLGSVDLRGTSSGDVNLRDIRGDVRVGSSGSGDLLFDRVAGNVTIGSVGSGDVSARDVTGDVSLDSIGSGDVSVNDVGGNLTVRSTGSGDVHRQNVRGKVSVPDDD